MSVIVSPNWVYKQVNEHPNDTVIVDVRFHLTKPEQGRKEYLAGHIPDAFFLDLDLDLSGDLGEHGGRHPLPDVEKVTKALGDIGIHSKSTVIAYDDNEGMYASRFWWQLHYLGHENIHILDGGYKNWLERGLEASTKLPEAVAVEYVPRVREEALVDVNGVKARIGNSNSVLVDSRDQARYLGAEEPLDHKAGHIPTAVNYFWKNVIDDEGRWKSVEGLTENYAGLDKTKEIIVYCGSGVSACPNVIGLKQAGFQNIKLYAGSWSDWISYPENEIATGEES
ncbi:MULTISPECIES: sulfurtransferase [Bacillus]|uniref:3-mercaptopyruvate sulfurtransferase n=2 Tax=Bacillus TaxID=1386 RepID=A0A0M5JC50_9BACI|nr:MULTISPECIES: sulfurtransferase [Bacillus]ALC82544.1 3-mercaptopyruvate sulfurtransferase [Bacillus gobiensis]MBP1081453.1 thiosulfate/3-mercaptopyruvate sulfurtransferase [Bacillus capparidis]MED1096124.1 sulfurtransferase [Bacillus capparidis]